MISSVFGIGIIALPSGIITAGFLKETNAKDKEQEESQKEGSDSIEK